MQKAHSAYHVAALNNLYARAADPDRMNEGSTTDSTRSLAAGDWEARLSAELLSLQALADEVDGEPEALLLLPRQGMVRVRRQARVMDLAHGRMRLEEPGHGVGDVGADVEPVQLQVVG